MHNVCNSISIIIRSIRILFNDCNQPILIYWNLLNFFWIDAELECFICMFRLRKKNNVKCSHSKSYCTHFPFAISTMHWAIPSQQSSEPIGSKAHFRKLSVKAVFTASSHFLLSTKELLKSFELRIANYNLRYTKEKKWMKTRVKGNLKISKMFVKRLSIPFQATMRFQFRTKAAKATSTWF